MTENMKKFLETVSKDAELSKKVGAMNKDELLVLAKKLGLALAEEDLIKPAQELEDDDLDTVAGGLDAECACFMGGGGAKDDDDKTCACVMAGFGVCKYDNERCVCAVAGYGGDSNHY